MFFLLRSESIVSSRFGFAGGISFVARDEAGSFVSRAASCLSVRRSVAPYGPKYPLGAGVAPSSARESYGFSPAAPHAPVAGSSERNGCHVFAGADLSN